MNKRHHIPLLLTVFFLSIFMLWQAWKEKQELAAKPQAPVVQQQAAASAGLNSVPTPQSAAPVKVQAEIPAAAAVAPTANAAVVEVKTDQFLVQISTEGGSLNRLELIHHHPSDDAKKNFVLFQNDEKSLYLGQTGLVGKGLPTHKTLFKSAATSYEMKDGEKELKVRLVAPEVDGVKVAKIYTFQRNSYVVGVEYEITNTNKSPLESSAYFQLVRDGHEPENSSPMGMGPSIFTGPAVFTEQDKYHKLSFEDIEKKKVKIPAKADNGWVAMVQHYFVSAWLPEGKVEREFFVRDLGNKLFSAGVILPVNVAAGATSKLVVPLYAGPQEQAHLSAVAPGLDLVVDYGWLTMIAAPLFWVMNWLNGFVGNWGWTIIVLTILLKLIFFPLSAASYKSMAKIRKVTPQMQKLKELHKEDKQRLNLEMMQLYKREQINPLGGCLPVVIQIPVFIALYWVLLASVEMRNAPWVGWIVDLSLKDPYYILPVLMGITMLIQTKLNPPPPDPMQAKMMMFMPVIFTGMFLFFPSGLVLYWCVSNVLSIAQQWAITRKVEAGELKV